MNRGECKIGGMNWGWLLILIQLKSWGRSDDFSDPNYFAPLIIL